MPRSSKCYSSFIDLSDFLYIWIYFLNLIFFVGGSGSSGSSSGFGARAPASPARPTQAPPQQVHHHYHGPPAAAAPQVGGGIGGGGLGSALATGMAMGAGSEIAHQAIRGIMGSGSSHGNAPAQQQQPAPVQQAPVQYAQPVYEQPQQVAQQQNPCMSFN